MSSAGIVRIDSCVSVPARAAQAAGALEQRRQVRVHVAREALAARDLALARRHLAQRLAVVRHVGEDHQHVLALDERQVLGGAQREARRQQALRARVAGQVQEQRRALERAALLEAAAEVLGAVVAARRCRRRRSTKSSSAPGAGARGSRSPPPAGRAAGRRPRTSGSFWPRTRLFIRSSVVMPVSMKSRGIARATGFIGSPSIGMRAVRGHRRPAVDDLADAVEDAPEDARAEAEGQRLAEKAHDGARRATARRSTRAPRSSGTARRSPRRDRAARGRRRRAPRPRRARPTSSVRRRNSSGPSSRVAAPSTVSRIAGLRGRRELRELALHPRLAARRGARARRRRSPRPCAAARAGSRCARCARARRRPRAPPRRDR